MSEDRSYYVYVYIDPRNFEEFYYGKGKGSRRLAHLAEESDSDKVARIRDIRREGVEPIIRTIAANLTEQEALLIETTLIWKLGKSLTNQASGRYASLFRPHNSLHRSVARFDFSNGLYYVNVGEGPNRNWDDCRRLGFLSAGQGPQWRDQILGLQPGDIVVAYLKRRGYVGVGRVVASALPYLQYREQGLLLHQHELRAPDMSENAESPDNCEHVMRVEWLASVPREDAKWKANAALFTKPLIRASLDRQPVTIAFIDEEFGVDLRALAT